MTSFAEAFKNLDLSGLEAGEELTEDQIQANRDIEMLEKYLKMCERNASEKERFLLAQEYGFLSEKHLKLWLSVNDDFHDKQEHLEDVREFTSPKVLKKMEKEVQELESRARLIRDKRYYRSLMVIMGIKDYSPYGENLLRAKMSDSSLVNVERTIAQGYVSHIF